MRTSPSDATVKAIKLQTGQCFHVHARRKDFLLVQSGSVRLIESPHWLGDLFSVSSYVITEGQAHQCDKSGWITVEALQSCFLLHDSGKVKQPQIHGQTTDLSMMTATSPLHRLRSWIHQLRQRRSTS